MPQSEDARSSKPPAQVPFLAPQHPLDRIRVLQQTIGNQGVLGRLQAKLAISEPGDTAEQKADRVAEGVMSNSKPGPAEAVPTVQGRTSAVIQRKCAQCEEENEKLQVQRRESSPVQSAAVPPIVEQVLNTPGQPVEHSTRGFMESRFSHDFSSVHVHTEVTSPRNTIRRPGCAV